jgi:hypothetical protein
VIRSWVVLFFGVTVLAFYGHDLWLYFAVQAAPVSALLEAPNAGFAGLATLLMITGIMATLRTPKAPPRLLTILTIVVLGFDFIVLSSVKSPLGTQARAKGALQVMTESAQALATTTAVPDALVDLDPVLPLLGPVPWLVHGQRPADWRLELRFDCTGPVTAAGALPVGTVLYCVAPERKRAWITLVGLPLAQARGEPGVVSSEPEWVGEVSLARENAEPADVDEEPTRDESR